METNLVLESLKFMVLGMGIVFLFLYVLVLLMQLQAFIIRKFFSNDKNSESLDTKKTNDTDEKRRIAAIIGAVLQHNKR
jgi:oxaloacetate decarboxylase gamma subunit